MVLIFLSFGATPGTFSFFARKKRGMAENPLGATFLFIKVNKMQKGTDFVGVAIVYFCYDADGRFLMAKRSANCRDEHGKWDIGGGGLEFGESVEETLKKEIKEEYCTDVLASEFLGYRDVHREHDGKKTHWVALDFKVLVDPATVANGEPHKFDELKWFNRNSIPADSELHSNLPRYFKLYSDKLWPADK